MDIDFFRSPIDAIAITIPLIGIFFLYKQQKHYGLLLACIGFIIILVTHISINFCIMIALGTDLLHSYPIACNPVIPYIKAGGYLLIGFGLFKFSEHIKNA